MDFVTIICGAWHPLGTLQYFENVLRQIGAVTYLGLPRGSDRAGYPADVNVSEIEADLFLYIEEWRPVFPRGLHAIDAPTAAFFTDVPYDLDHRIRMASFFDHLFVAHKDYLQAFREVHPSVHWLPFASGIGVDEPQAYERKVEVGFVGGAGGERLRWLERLEKEFVINEFRRRYTLEEMTNLYARSKIVFNKSEAGEVNFRVFEGPSCGALLVTEEAPGLEELFEPGKEIITYRSFEEAYEKIRYFLRNDEERRRIAEAGYKRARNEHTFEHRVRRLIDVVAEGNRMAPIRRNDKGELLEAYARVYASFPMINELRTLLADSDADRLARLKAVGYAAEGFLRGWRRMGWKNFIKV